MKFYQLMTVIILPVFLLSLAAGCSKKPAKTASTMADPSTQSLPVLAQNNMGQVYEEQMQQISENTFEAFQDDFRQPPPKSEETSLTD